MIVCFGEPLLRLQAPRSELLLQSARFEVHFGGAEANVAVSLSCLGQRSRLVTVLPDNALGKAALSYFQSHGVDCTEVVRRSGRMGLYFTSQAAGHRPTSVVYDRQQSAFTEFGFKEVSWDKLLQGASRLHVSGITLALRSSLAKATLDAVAAARGAGIAVSFDCNFRQQLWSRSELEPGAAMAEIVRYADIMFGNFRDIGLLLGCEFAGETASDLRTASSAAFAAFPSLRYIASTQRRIVSAREHFLAARLDMPDEYYQTDEQHIVDIVDRIGSGDAFAAGFLDGIFAQLSPKDMLHRGLALACLKHGLPGDASLYSKADLDQWTGKVADVDR